MRFTELAMRKLKMRFGATTIRRTFSARPQLEVLEDRLPVNWSPLAMNDSWNLLEDQQLGVQSPGVLANDTDEDPLTALLVDGPTSGQLTFNADGSFTYVPQADHHGQVTFTYKAFDGIDWSNIATVTLTIQAVNDAPEALDDSFSTDEDTGVTLDVLANDSDVDGDAVNITSFTNPDHGSVTLNQNQTFTYTPQAGWSGQDSFDYTISDPSGATSTATVNITVNQVGPAFDDTAVLMRTRPSRLTFLPTTTAARRSRPRAVRATAR